jgi:hypothetical protein
MKYLNIDLLYSLLTIDGKRALLELLENDVELRIKNHEEIEIRDWLQIEWVKQMSSIRLHNALLSESWGTGRLRGMRLNDVKKIDILSIRNSGLKCWEQFQKMRDEYNEAVKK